MVAGRELAIELDECRNRRYGRYGLVGCACRPVCEVCGFGPHMAVHGPFYGAPPGSKPYDHEFRAAVGALPTPQGDE